MNDPAGQVLDLMSMLVDPAVRDLPSFVRGLFGGEG